MVYCRRCLGAALSPQAGPTGISAVSAHLSEWKGHLNSSGHPECVFACMCVACAWVCSPRVWMVITTWPVTKSSVNGIGLFAELFC